MPGWLGAALCLLSTCTVAWAGSEASQTYQITRADYLDRVQAAWTAQIVACMMGFQFEHKVGSVEFVTNYPQKVESAIVDDDWYYEMCALRAFEKYGTGLRVQQLGEQWKENSCGSWGSSEQARLNLQKGIKAPDCGHPRYNKLWFTIGPQFSSEIYGLLAPGMPDLAAGLAREMGHVNGYAEATDGAVFMAGMVSLGFVESDPQVIVKKAAQLIHPDSPYRQCLDMIIGLAKAGRSPEQIAGAVEDKWRIEYPVSNNAVANGGLVAVALWFGQGDFLQTANLIYRLEDFTDADCNAANAGAVLAAMHGMKALPRHLVAALHDRIIGDEMGGVKLTPPVDEKISDLARRTAAVGEKFLVENGGKIVGEVISGPRQEPHTQSAELFSLRELMKIWNPAWTLERAGWGGSSGGKIRGITCLDGTVLSTWPRDPARGVVLRRSVKAGKNPKLSFEAGVDEGHAWELNIYAGNKRIYQKLMDGGNGAGQERKWQEMKIDLSSFAGAEITLRLYQRVILANKIPGNAYWRNLTITE
jgi:hypothetical protein